MTLEILTSDNLSGMRHGFFTRRGGVSAGIFKGLNCGMGSSDQDDIILLNRKLVAEAMGVHLDDLVTIHQVHSADAVTVSHANDATGQADAVVTNTPGIALGILTADCAPILFADDKANVVAAAHSGWKGALSGIIESTVAAMEKLGANRSDIKASIGPCISQRNYEVGPEFFDSFMAEDPDLSRFFAQGNGDRMQFDLPSFCLHQLRASGLQDVNWIGHCTYADPDRFFSYRRTTHLKEADYGRLISVIKANG